MKSITVTVNGPNRIQDAKLPAYRVDVSITGANDITTKLFVKQRILKPEGTTEDNFVAVASPTNLEDFAEDAPLVDSSFFRSNSISLASSDPAFLSSTLETILSELSLLTKQMEILDENSSITTNYTVTSSGVTF